MSESIVNKTQRFNRENTNMGNGKTHCCDYPVLGKTESFEDVTTLTISHSKLVKNSIQLLDTDGEVFSASITYAADGKSAVIDFAGTPTSGTVAYFIKSF